LCVFKWKMNIKEVLLVNFVFENRGKFSFPLNLTNSGFSKTSVENDPREIFWQQKVSNFLFLKNG
jgi:hypothetical protein